MLKKLTWGSITAVLVIAALMLGSYAPEVYAQLMQLTDGTFASKVVIYGSGGTEVTEFGEAGTVAAIEAVEDAVTALNADLEPACDTTVAISENASGNQQLINDVSDQIIKVCGGVIIAEGTVVVQFVRGTGTDCATGEADVTGAMSLKVDGTQPPGFAVQEFFMSTATNELCIELSAAVQVSGYITYTQYTP